MAQDATPGVLGCNEGLGARRVHTSLWCRACRAPLKLDEMHYYEDGDGTAACDRCERRWSEECNAYMRGERDTPPRRP